jgi:5-methylcytosine-specific restriction protein B
LADVFVEHASDEALSLLPGHAYFLAASDEMFAKRLRYDILPLLDDYLRQGVLGSAAPELHAVRNALEDEYLLEAYG